MTVAAWTLVCLMVAVPWLVISRLRRSGRLAIEAQFRAEQAYQALARERATDAIVERLRSSDPDFDPRRFEARVTGAFVAVQRARATGDLRDARTLVSDSVYERLGLELEDRRSRGRPEGSPVTHDVFVEAVHLAHVEAGSVFDKLTVGIRARGEGEPFGEFWTFLRRHGARTRNAPGLLERRCPNCAAPIERVEQAHCESCGTLLRSGEHDWVLAEITQPESWQPRAASRIAGIDVLQSADPGFSPQHLEDRVGLIFWRMALAERERSGTERLVAVADPGWCERFSAEQRALRRPSRLAATQGLELRGIDMVGVRQKAGWHRVAVTVHWSGALAPGPLRRVLRPMRGSRVFVLARRVGVTTDLLQAVSSAHCARCGAPERIGSGADCAYCGETLNDGRHGWILVDAVEARTDRARAIVMDFSRRATAPAEPALDLLNEHAFPWIAKLLTAGRTLTAADGRFLAELAARWDVDAANQALSQDEDPAKQEDFGPDAIRRALPVLVDIGLTRDALGAGGRRMLTELAARAGLTALDVHTCIDQRTREWDGRAEAVREAEAKRERSQERLAYDRLVASQHKH